MLYENHMISRTKISRGNLTVVPKGVRRPLGLRPGDLLEWEIEADRIVVKPRKKRSLEDITAMIAVGGDAVKDKKRAQRGEL